MCDRLFNAHVTVDLMHTWQVI